MALSLSISEQRLVASQRVRADFDEALEEYQQALETTSRLREELTKAREDEEAADKRMTALGKLLNAIQESYGDLEGDILRDGDTGEVFMVVAEERPNESSGSG
jgi:hypothetical protein